MKLYSIEDGYLFKTDQPKGTHTYAVYYDRKKKEYHAVPTTHLYKPDAKRMKQKDSGYLMQMKFSNFVLPSGVKNYAHTTDVNGRKINVKDPRVREVSKKHLPKKLSEKIFDHACGRYTVKKRKVKKKRA